MELLPKSAMVFRYNIFERKHWK